MRGPRWRRHFGIVSEKLGAPEPRAPLKKRTFLFYDFSADVAELVVEELRPGVAAMWVDVRERLGL